MGLRLHHRMKAAADELDERAFTGSVGSKNGCGFAYPEPQGQVFDYALTSGPSLDGLKVQPRWVVPACVLKGHGVIVAAEPMGSR